MKLTVEINEECLSQDPVYCESFDSGFRCFFHMGNGANDVPGYRCDYHNILLNDDHTYQSLRCDECKKQNQNNH